MAKAELKMDTAEAMEKIEALNAEVEKLKAAMICVKRAAESTTKAMRDFVEACATLDVDL
jgi:predicted translin family RNA/ssDNA-binding protein